MRLDIRTPIGGLFAVLGLILTVYGLVTMRRADLYVRSLGTNMNLWWGLIMLAFGVMMLVLGRRASRRPLEPTETPEPGPARPGH